MNLPNVFSESNNILFSGIGGGFDIFGAIPIWVKLRLKNRKFVFSNYNGLYHKFGGPDLYPEKQLDEILKKNEFDVPIYGLPKSGVKAYYEMYSKIIEDHKIDTVVAVDGGVDGLMHGDEEGAGTFLEDFANLIAIDKLDCKKIFVCSGFGTEMEEGVCHHHTLENIAALADNFLGSCSLIKDSEEFNIYKTICEWVWQHGRESHIQTKVISSVLGMFGNDNLYKNVEANIANAQVKNYLSPLMGIYWFFDLRGVMNKNVLYDILSNTTTKTDLLMAYRQSIDSIKLRPKKALPW